MRQAQINDAGSTGRCNNTCISPYYFNQATWAGIPILDLGVRDLGQLLGEADVFKLQRLRALLSLFVEINSLAAKHRAIQKLLRSFENRFLLMLIFLFCAHGCMEYQ
jgi:hypothetical protein